MTLLATFPQWDTDLFLFLNGLHHPAFDAVMWWISGNFTFIPLYIFIIVAPGLQRKWRRTLWLTLGIIVCIALADRISSGLIKPLFERWRPSREPALEGLVHTLRGYTGGRYGFVSSHAANHFAFAAFTALAFGRRWYSVAIVALAAVIGYSRIYLGVHYPLDVFCGALLGVAIGVGVYFACRYAEKKFTARRRRKPNNKTAFDPKP